MKTKDYRQYLRAVGRKPVKGPVRTEKQAGHLEIVWCPKSKDYVIHRYGEAA